MFKFELAGLYKFTVRKADESLVSESDWMNNIITNQGLDAIGAAGYMTGCRVGTGTATPAATDTALQNSIAATTSIQSTATSFSSVSPYYSSVIRTWRFGVGVAAGNLSEVGVFISTSASSCGSRALIVDGGGSPTTITVLSDEILDVTYEARTYMMETDATGVVTMEGVDYDWTARSSNAAGGSQYGWPLSGTNAFFNQAVACSGALASVTSSPTGAYSAVNINWAAYVTGTYQRSASAVWNISTANGNWNALRLVYNLGAAGPLFQVGLDPTFVKDNTKNVTMTFRVTWARRP